MPVPPPPLTQLLPVPEKSAVWLRPIVVNVCGAEKVQPASVAVTVYVSPPLRENEYFPVESVFWLVAVPPVMDTVAPASAPLGPVTVPEIVNVESALLVDIT